MDGRGETKKVCSKGYSESLKEDRISQLPDPLICHILSHLSTKENVKTSVLSTRWTSLWLWVPLLELSSRTFSDLSAFVSFGDRFFHSSRVSCIHKFKLTILYGSFITHFTLWIDAAVKRNVQHLNVSFASEMPLSLYTCEALVSLKLHLVALPNAEFVSLPCLKIMRLKHIRYPNEPTFERLVSSCPVLEELEIQGHVNYGAQLLRVLSRSLERLVMKIHFPLSHSDSGILIDAPRLRFLSIEDNLPESFIITNMDSNVKVDIYLGSGLAIETTDFLSKRNRLCRFLTEISKVGDMIIHLNTFELLRECSKLGPLPQFGYMSRLQVALSYSKSKWLLTFLESFPNLKSLSLVCYNDYKKRPFEGKNQISFPSVPECLLSSLEFVDFKVFAAEMKLIRYFLENSVILKKLTLHLRYDAIQNDFVKKLLKLPRRSNECKVVFL